MLKRLLKRLLEASGYTVVPDGWSPRRLRRPGFAPRVVVDVGVASGTARLYQAFPEAYFLLIEALGENEPHLREILHRYRGDYVIAAAGASQGKGIINVEPVQQGRGSSLLTRTAQTSKGVRLERREVPIETLDSLVAGRHLQGPFGLKIDTEGFELEVIRGATNLLRETQFVLAEVSVIERFEGSYSFSDFIAAMSEREFELSDVLSVGRSRGKAIHIDALFTPRAPTPGATGSKSR
ncbi:MAG: hypothetical protein AMXMBFR33_42850 [Candidatus Xenobia bacterium]